MEPIHFHDLVVRFGDAEALSLLQSVEKVARIHDEITCLNEEERFQRALDALTAINFAA